MRRLGCLSCSTILVTILVLTECGLRVAGTLYLHRFHAAASGPPNAIRVLCLGESSTAGLWLERPDSYPGQLEAALRVAYGDPRILAVVPPHLGQNTSQMSHRIDAYLTQFAPRLVVVMAGYNNEWSLAESGIGAFLDDRRQRWRAQLLSRLEGLRLFRLARWTRLQLEHRLDDLADDPEYLWGAPELVRYPPAADVYAFAAAHPRAFVALWRHDVGRILAAAQARRVKGLLMTYHINPSYLSAQEFEGLAQRLGVPLVRNDQGFARARERTSADELLFDDDWHPNRKGYAIIARGAFDAILANDLLGLGAPKVAEWSGDASVASPNWSNAGLALGERSAEPWLGRGWSRPEGGFRWTDGPSAEIHFGRPAWPAPILGLRMRPFLGPGVGEQRVIVSVNGEALANWRLDRDEAQTLQVALEGELRDENTVTLRLDDAASPRSVGAGEDDRRLALAVERVFLGPPALPRGTIAADEAEAYLGAGWAAAEGGFRWSTAGTAEIVFRTESGGPRTLGVRLTPFLAKGRIARQRVRWLLDRKEPRTLELRGSRPIQLEIPVPAAAASHTLRLELPDAAAPAAFGESDTRLLAVALHGLEGRP